MKKAVVKLTDEQKKLNAALEYGKIENLEWQMKISSCIECSPTFGRSTQRKKGRNHY